MSSYMPNRSRHDEAESFFCRFTFGQFFALLVLEVFTLFFVFYLGARYGRGLLGLDRPPAVALESANHAAGGKAESRVMTTQDPEVAKMAGELMAKADTPELKDRIKEMIDQAQGPRAGMPDVVAVERREPPPLAPEPVAPSVEQRPPAAESPPLAQQEAPAARPGSSAADTAAASDSSVIRVKSGQNARYSVQIGSYPDLAEGTKIAEKWKGKGYPAFIMIADIPDRGRWYRVRIGGFENREDAMRYMQELSAKENVEALVVLNEQ
ncbi:MAG: SPOR domain-containing protein [Proteobacteria bacterium]|nr:SPOR domain-containing protein [Pseudomonadota bacterium]